MLRTETLTGKPREARAAPGPYLVLALDAARPDAGSERWSLAEVDEVRIGRGAIRSARRERRALIVELPDPALSGKHARLVRGDDGWTLEDAGSKNGTHLAGVSIDRAELDDRAVIDVGRTFLVFRARRGAIDPGDATFGLDGDALDTLDPALADTFASLTRVARSPVPVLVLGETGTGKERVAQAVHAASERRGACVAVNCAALPANLVESELFGYRRGAFSGANEDRAGLVRASDGGTLFLDEVADLAPGSQASLLRVLQEREVVPLGTTAPVPVDLRVVAATCQDPDALVSLGRFREDLLARLAGHTVRLPPLRERTEDLGLLIARLLARHAARRRVALDRDVARALFHHDWPRNVRELDHTLAAALARADGGELGLAHLPAGFVARDPRPAAAAPDRDRLEQLLRSHGGNVSKVAKALGTSRSQVRRLAERVGLDVDAFRA